MSTEPPPLLLQTRRGSVALQAPPARCAWVAAVYVAPAVFLLFLVLRLAEPLPSQSLATVSIPRSPRGFLVSLIGLARGADRAAAVAGMLLSGLCMALLFGLPLLVRLCR